MAADRHEAALDHDAGHVARSELRTCVEHGDAVVGQDALHFCRQAAKARDLEVMADETGCMHQVNARGLEQTGLRVP